MTKAHETDLLPWILGAFLMAAGAVATVIATSAPTNSPAAISAPPTAAAIANTPAATPAPMAVQTTASPPLPPGQVWQCVVNGQPTFSDSPCSNSASVRQLSQLNRMDATNVPAPAASYSSSVPEYMPAVADPNTDDGGDSYACRTLKAEVRSINERMRHGYSIPEGEYLRARLREINDIQYEKSCLR